MSTAHTASCRCGAVRAVARAEPFWRSYCHCADCRRQTGAPVNAFVGFRDGEIEWRGEEAKAYRNGSVERRFCETCGSQIAYLDDRLAGDIYLSLGFMDAPQDFPPTLHAFETHRLPFVQMSDDLPRYPRFSVQR